MGLMPCGFTWLLMPLWRSYIIRQTAKDFHTQITRGKGIITNT